MEAPRANNPDLQVKLTKTDPEGAILRARKRHKNVNPHLVDVPVPQRNLREGKRKCHTKETYVLLHDKRCGIRLGTRDLVCDQQA